MKLVSFSPGHNAAPMQYPLDVDTASSKPADLDVPVPTVLQSTTIEDPSFLISTLPPSLVQELWLTAEAKACGLSLDEFSVALTSVGKKVNCGLPPGEVPDSTQKAAFFRSLHLAELALAHSCALGRDAAWEAFLTRYRNSLVQTAISIAGSATVGQDLADSLYAELYGLRQTDGERRAPLASYSGRGSLAGWLRTTLIQRFRDHHRRTHRESPLDNLDNPSPVPTIPIPQNLAQLTVAVARTLRGIEAEDRFLLSAYYLDRQTLLQIAQTLAVHEATISRRLKRLADNLRKQLIENLIARGLSKVAAEEALGADPRDIEINLRKLLQTSQTSTFSNQTESTAAIEPI
jgi:RNA polymerase sigma-70 factor (ECF subfamily)